MGRKVYTAYKYHDQSVQTLPGVAGVTTVRDYITLIQDKLESEDHINKGERDDEDLSDFKDETIASSLRTRIFDSSITIVAISPRMKDTTQYEKDQWIPWEIAYSLRESTRNGRTSASGGLLAVVLPNEAGEYSYAIKPVCATCGTVSYERSVMFDIMSKHLFNINNPEYTQCGHSGEPRKVFPYHSSYMVMVRWDQFSVAPTWYIEEAFTRSKNADKYKITKMVQ